MKHPRTRAIIANGEIARSYDLKRSGNSLSLTEVATLKAAEINAPSDTQGMTHSRVGHSQHRLAPHNGPDKAKESFAADIADYLTSEVADERFERLVLVAGPRMMGILLDRLDTNVQSRIWAQITKNLASHPAEKLNDALSEALYPQL